MHGKLLLRISAATTYFMVDAQTPQFQDTERVAQKYLNMNMLGRNFKRTMMNFEFSVNIERN